MLLDSHSSKSELLVPVEMIVPMGLAHEMPNITGYDLAVCLYYAEHLPASRAFPLIECLTQTTTLALFSATLFAKRRRPDGSCDGVRSDHVSS